MDVCTSETLCLSAMQITMKASVHYDDTNTMEKPPVFSVGF